MTLLAFEFKRKKGEESRGRMEKWWVSWESVVRLSGLELSLPCLSGLAGLGQRMVFSVCFCFVFWFSFTWGLVTCSCWCLFLFYFPYSIIGFNGPFCCNIFYSLNWWQLLTIKNIWETIFVIFLTSLLG
jgi:hypothetical protein